MCIRDRVTTWHDGEGEVSIELLDAAGNTVATGKGPDITLTIFNAQMCIRDRLRSSALPCTGICWALTV